MTTEPAALPPLTTDQQELVRRYADALIRSHAAAALVIQASLAIMAAGREDPRVAELERAMSSASERQFAASLEASDVWAQLTVGAS